MTDNSTNQERRNQVFVQETHYFNININTKQNRVELHIRGDFPRVNLIGEYLEKLYQLSEEYATCLIFINSPGGDTATLTEIISCLKGFDTIITVGTGNVHSAGLILWSLGDIRFIQEYTSIMIHRESYFGGYMKTNQHLDQANHINEIYSKMVADICTFATKEEIEKIKHTEVFYTSQELINRGAALPWTQFQDGEGKSMTPALVIGQDVYAGIQGNLVSDLEGNVWDINDIVYETGRPPVVPNNTEEVVDEPTQ